MTNQQIISELQVMLQYCQEQNGRSDCKNCGLSPEIVEAIIMVLSEKDNIKGI